MITQSLINHITLCNFLVSSTLPGPANRQPNSADPLDYGFDFDEDELARELGAPLSVSLADQTAGPVEADDFEKLYNWFIS